MHTFAYGSNLDGADLDRWCDSRGVPRVTLDRPVRGFLPDRRLAFSHRSKSRGGGVLDVVEAPGHAVEGIMFEVSNAALDALDLKESSGHVYRRFSRTILTEDGLASEASVYEVEPGHRFPHVPPAANYLEIVRNAYKAHGIDAAALDAAAEGLSAPGPVAHLFVYGTLMSGESRARVLPAHGARLAGAASIPGRLVDLGDHPGLLLCGDGARVEGELHRLGEREALFRETDGIEEFPGYGGSPWVFRRAIVSARTSAGGSVPAWVYVYDGPSGGRRTLRSGSWRVKDVP